MGAVARRWGGLGCGLGLKAEAAGRVRLQDVDRGKAEAREVVLELVRYGVPFSPLSSDGAGLRLATVCQRGGSAAWGAQGRGGRRRASVRVEALRSWTHNGSW